MAAGCHPEMAIRSIQRAVAVNLPKRSLLSAFATAGELASTVLLMGRVQGTDASHGKKDRAEAS